MTDNPFSSPTAERDPQESSGSSVTGFVLKSLRYLASYVLGIVASLALTPADLSLAGVPLWPWYPVFAVFGFFLFFFYLTPTYTFGPGLGHWQAIAFGLTPIICEVMAFFIGSKRLRQWRPWWIGFPIGFVGTLGEFYTAAQSI